MFVCADARCLANPGQALTSCGVALPARKRRKFGAARGSGGAMAYQKYFAELFGTAVLVLIGCSSIVLAGFGGAFPIGIIGIGLTFGMTVTAMAYTIGPV